MRNLTLPEDLHEKCAVLLRLYDSTSTEWQLGKNKVNNLTVCIVGLVLMQS